MLISEDIPDDVSLVTLVEGARTGQSEAWNTLMERYMPMVQTIAWKKTGNRHLVEDIVQEVFIRAMRNIHQLKQPLAFPSWLCQIAHYCGVNMMCRGEKALSMGDTRIMNDVRDICSNDGPLDIAIRREEAAVLRKAVATLRPMDRDAITMFHFDENNLEEMRGLLKVPLGTIKRRLFTARHRLREKLDRATG